MFKFSGGVISWRSKKQSIVAFFSPEAEYVALSASSREAICLEGIGLELELYKESPILILGENTVPLGMDKESRLTDTSKHISIQYHFIRSIRKGQVIEVQYVTSENNTTDVLTKGLARILN